MAEGGRMDVESDGHVRGFYVLYHLEEHVHKTEHGPCGNAAFRHHRRIGVKRAVNQAVAIDQN